VQYLLNPEMRVTPTVTVVSLGEFASVSTTNRLGNTPKLVQIEGTVGFASNYGFVGQITFSSEL
jgi:hypothetical protein